MTGHALKTCEICGLDISGRRAEAKYCSKACSQKAYVANNRDKVKELKAAEYLRNKERNQPKRDEAAFRAKEARAVAKGIDLRNRRCMVCGVMVPSHLRLDAMYCSIRCNKKASRDRNPEHTKQLRAASYERNRDHVLPKRRESYEANKSEISLRDRRARAARMGIDFDNRRCVSCQELLPVERTLKTKYCEACYVALERERARVQANLDYVRRTEEIKTRVRAYAQSARGRAQRSAWLSRNPTYMRDHKREAHRGKVGYRPEGRRCVDCSADIAVTAGHNARFCPTCRERRFGPRAWSCVVCSKEFSRKRARAPLCSKACRRIRRKANRKAEYDALRREWRESRICRRCGTSISETSSSTLYCSNCSELQRRACSSRGVRARRARKMGRLGYVSADIESILLEKQRYRCAAPWCKHRIAKRPNRYTRKYELDHFVPLARDGWHDNANLQLLCYPCHRRKGTKMPNTWYQDHGYLL